MKHKFTNAFCWKDMEELRASKLTDQEKYQILVRWAGEARGKNPNAFDDLTDWILEDSLWGDNELSENEQCLMQRVIGRFKEQTAQLRACLEEIKPSGIVNEAVFKAIERFDDELTGKTHAPELKPAVERMFSDFSSMKERKVRRLIAGGRTGAAGTEYVEVMGYINFLKDCDAAIQWALFMPDAIKAQQRGFRVESFEYKRMPAMRFIGQEANERLLNPEARREIYDVLDAMTEYRSGFDYDILFEHHFGRNVDVERWHGYWGRFMKMDTPVPEGFMAFDLLPDRKGEAGPPYISQFAYAAFAGDMEAMHTREGFDAYAMYDVTRNIMLGQGVMIPYPDKYWTAEVFLNGHEKESTAYLFSAELDV